MAVFKLNNDDIFISYCRSDATTYTDGLANELTKKGFSCFTDALGTDANKDLPPTLIGKLKACRMLVIIGSADASKSGPVAREIELFIAARGSSAIVPIDVNGMTDQAIWKDYITGLRRERESPDSLLKGDPSPAVVHRIEKAFAYRKSKESLKVYTRTAVIILGLLIVAMTAAAYTATLQAKKARDAAQDAGKKTELAKKASANAQRQTELARLAEHKAGQMADSARVMSAKKDAAEAEFLLASQKAKVATALAERQQKIATAFQYANESQELLEHPDSISSSVSKAVQSMEIAAQANIHSLSADGALRSSMALLPDLKSNQSYTGGQFYLTGNGTVIEEKATDSVRQFYKEGNQVPFFKAGCAALGCDPYHPAIAVSSDGNHIVSISENVIHVANTIDNTIKDYASLEPDYWRFQLMAISPDGRYLAASLHGDESDGFDRIYIWDRKSDSLVELSNDININSMSFSPDGSVFAVGGRGYDYRGKGSGKALIWDLSNLGLYAFEKSYFDRPYMQLQDAEISGIAAGPDHRIFATNQGSNITIWQSDIHQKYRPISYIPGTTDSSNFVFLPGKNDIAVLGGGETRKQMNTWTYRNYASQDKWLMQDDVEFITYSRQNDEILSLRRYAGTDGSGRLGRWRYGADKSDFTYGNDFNAEELKYYTKDLQYIVTISDSLHIWNKTNLQYVVPVDTGIRIPELITLTDDGRILAWIRKDENGQQQAIQILKLIHNHYQLVDSIALTKPVSTMELSVDGASLFLKDEEGLQILDIASKRSKLCSYNGKPAPGQSFRLSPQGGFISSQDEGYDDETQKNFVSLYTWNARSGQLVGALLKMKCGTGGSLPYVWEPNGKHILLSFGNIIGIWAPGSGKKVINIDNASMVTALSFSPSGKYFGIGTERGALRIFKSATLTEISQVSNEGKVTEIIFSPDDQYCTITTDNSTMLDLDSPENLSIATWQISPDGMIRTAKQRLEKMTTYKAGVK